MMVHLKIHLRLESIWATCWWGREGDGLPINNINSRNLGAPNMYYSIPFFTDDFRTRPRPNRYLLEIYRQYLFNEA